MKIFRAFLKFEWDEGNKGKNFRKHKVTNEECEEAFFDQKKKVLRDAIHSDKEERHILLGQTKRQRTLFIVFTMRQGNIRIISARDLNTKEKRLFL